MPPISIPLLFFKIIHNRILLFIDINLSLWFYYQILQLFFSIQYIMLSFRLIREYRRHFDLRPNKLSILCLFCKLKPRPSFHQTLYQIGVVTSSNEKLYLISVLLGYVNNHIIRNWYFPYKISIIIHLKRRFEFYILLWW